MKEIKIFIVLLLGVSLQVQAVTYRTLKDVSYVASDDAYARERCKLDIYYPEDTVGCPVVVWFHGGGLTGGEKFIPGSLKDCGMVVIGVNYRLIPEVTLNECLDDAAAAVAWAFHNAARYGGDKDKIFVSGHSAGGYLTSMVGLDKRWLKKYAIDADSIAGLVPFSGQAITHFSHRQQKGIRATQPVIDEFAPLFHVRPDAPPLVIITGDREMELFGRYEENAYFWRMMRLVGHKETFLYEIGGHNHGDMGGPAFHILKEHIKTVLQTKSIK